MSANNKTTDDHILRRIFNSNTPLVLYIGRKQTTLSPAVINYPWNCIVTTRQNDGLATKFLEENKRKVEELFTHQQVDEKVALSQRYLKFVHLFGNDHTVLPRIKKNNAIEMLKLVASRMRSGFGSLVIIGYDPTDEEELPFERLADVLDGMRKNSVFIFEPSASLSADEDFLAAVDDGQLMTFDSALEYSLDQLTTLDGTEDQDDDGASFTEESNIFFINGKLASVEANDLFYTQGFAKLLTTAELGDLAVPPTLRKEYFSKFLMESTYAPMWFGYENEFNVHRHFENELYKKVTAALKNIEDRESQPLIVLTGQTGNSKSIALAQLAYKIYQKRTYPVIFINDKNVSLKYGSGNFNALEQLIHLLERKGARTVLLIWDNSAAYADPIPEARQLLRALRRRGRQCVLVSSAYMLFERKLEGSQMGGVKVDQVVVDIDLKQEEADELRNKTLKLGSISPEQYDAWQEREHGKNLLVLLYRLFMNILGEPIAQGVSNEVNQTTQTVLDPLTDNFAFDKPETLNGLAVHLIKAGLRPRNENKDEATQPDERAKVEKLLHLVAIASQFGVDLPLYFVATVAGLQHWENNFSIIRSLYSIPFLRLPEAPDIDGQNYGLSIGFRTPLEAKLYIEKSVPMEEEADFVVELIDALSDEYRNMEAKALDLLIRTIGPNSPLHKQYEWAEKIRAFKPHYPRIIEALSRMRTTRKILVPRLMCQEVTWLREVYGKDYSLPTNVRKEKLAEAMYIADGALKKIIPGKFAQEEQITRNSLIVERATSAWQIHMLRQAESGTNELVGLAFDYSIHYEALKEVIRSAPESSYAYNALLKLFIEMYKNSPSAEYRVNELGNILELLDSFEYMMDEASNNEEFIEHKNDIMAFISDDAVERHIDELIARGKSAGLFLLGKRRLQAANIDLDVSVLQDQHNTLTDIVDVFENHQNLVKDHAGSLYMLLRLKWHLYNHSPIFASEKQFTSMSQDQWEELAKICRSYSLSVQAQGNIPHLLYIFALVEAQTGNYNGSLNMQDKLNKVLWLPSRSNYVWHILSNDNGESKLFSGRVEQQQASAGMRYTKLQVLDVRETGNDARKINKPVYARNLQALQINKPSGTYNDFEIGLNFKGFQAFRKLKMGS